MGRRRSPRGGAFTPFPGPPASVVGPPVTDADTYPNGSLFYPPADVNGRVVAQAGKKVFLSRDDGTTWTSVALPPGNAELVSPPALPTPTPAYCSPND